MRSAFFELGIAISGIHAINTKLHVAGHNISNAATPGFSRQYATQSAMSPMSTFNGKGMIGTGTRITSVGQIRNNFLDIKFWSHSGIKGEYDSKFDQLSLLEQIGVNSDPENPNTLKNLFEVFFNQIRELSTDVGSGTYKMSFIDTLNTLTQSVNSSYRRLQEQQKDVNDEVRITVNQINNLGQQIAFLNNQIIMLEASGDYANDLRDQRALLIDELSTYINVEVSEFTRENGSVQFNISIDGQDFIRGREVINLRVERRQEKTNPTDIEGIFDIYFEGMNNKLNIYSSTLQGTLKGLIDVRDGNSGAYGHGDSVITANTITMTNLNRLDFSEEGGKITLFDSNTGRRFEFFYTSYVFDENTGEATFTINPDTPIPASAFNFEVRIGETNNFRGIPHYLNKLNDLVRTFVKAINEGKDRDGDPIPGVTGHINGYDSNGENLYTLLFTSPNSPSRDPLPNNALGPEGLTDYQYSRYTAGDFQLNDDIMDDHDLLAFYSTENIDDISENILVLDLSLVEEYRGLFAEGKLDNYIISISSELAVDVRQASNFNRDYSEITAIIDNQRKSVSSVSVDEESMNLVILQQTYGALAQLITKIDSIYDITINRMGL